MCPLGEIALYMKVSPFNEVSSHVYMSKEYLFCPVSRIVLSYCVTVKTVWYFPPLLVVFLLFTFLYNVIFIWCLTPLSTIFQLYRKIPAIR